MSNSRRGGFKIYVGRLTDDTAPKHIVPLFAFYGKVLACDVLKNFGFVHMESEEAAREAIKNLNGIVVNGSMIVVQESKNRTGGSPMGMMGMSPPQQQQPPPPQQQQQQLQQPPPPPPPQMMMQPPQQMSVPPPPPQLMQMHMRPGETVKIFVGNLTSAITSKDLRALFGQYGHVAECDIITNYGFVHIHTDNIARMIETLDGTTLNGVPIKVKLSTSKLRQKPTAGGDMDHSHQQHMENHMNAQNAANMMQTASVNLPYQQDMYQQMAQVPSYYGDMPYTMSHDPRNYYNQYYQTAFRNDQYMQQAAASNTAATVAAAAAVAAATPNIDYSNYYANRTQAPNMSQYTSQKTFVGPGPAIVPYDYQEKTWARNAVIDSANTCSTTAAVNPYTPAATNERVPNYEDYPSDNYNTSSYEYDQTYNYDGYGGNETPANVIPLVNHQFNQ